MSEMSPPKPGPRPGPQPGTHSGDAHAPQASFDSDALIDELDIIADQPLADRAARLDALHARLSSELDRADAR